MNATSNKSPRNGSGESFDSCIDQHASESDPRNPQLNGAEHDVQREQCIENIPNAGNQSNNAGHAKAEATRQSKRVIESARERLNVRNAEIDDLRREGMVPISRDSMG